MRRLPAEDEQEILNLLLQGVAYRKISRQRDTGISTVARVAEDAREKTPDFDSLRDLSVLLKKAGLSVFDATRASRLMEALNMLGIGADELGDYVGLTEKFLSQKTLNEDFLFYAMKLARLEKMSGGTYREAVEAFERKINEAAQAEERKLALENESLGLKTELMETNARLAALKSEIEKATTVRRALTRIGLHKLAQLVRFIQDFEALGLDANQVKRLAMWHQGLLKLQIDPDGLGKFIAEKGPLEAQNNSLRFANERIAGDVNTQATKKATLVAGNSVLQAVDRILATRAFTMPCRSCGYPLPTALPTKESLQDLLSTGKVLTLRCPNCGFQQFFSPWEIALQIAWTILPTDIVTI